MKRIRPGQFWAHNGCIVRARKRTSGCTGCIYEQNIMLCPDVKLKNSHAEQPNCVINNIIFTKP